MSVITEWFYIPLSPRQSLSRSLNYLRTKKLLDSRLKHSGMTDDVNAWLNFRNDKNKTIRQALYFSLPLREEG